MNATINVGHADLDNCDITIEQFQEAVSYALSNLTHPKTGEPIYFNGVSVMIVADCLEIAAV